MTGIDLISTSFFDVKSTSYFHLYFDLESTSDFQRCFEIASFVEVFRNKIDVDDHIFGRIFSPIYLHPRHVNSCTTEFWYFIGVFTLVNRNELLFVVYQKITNVHFIFSKGVLLFKNEWVSLVPYLPR